MKVSLRSIWFLAAGFFIPFAAFAEEGAHAAAAGGVTWAHPLSVGFAFALAVVAGATAQGKIGAAFMEGVSRNPGAQKSMFVPLIIALALVESLVLVCFVVVNSLAGKF